ncbi:MAG: hypothetical protein PHQ27_09990, partial [Victivallales bacterium]|nr:hypothetical protein [Victivallales bacterium]
MIDAICRYLTSGYAVIPAALLLLAGTALTWPGRRHVGIKIAAGFLFVLGMGLMVQIAAIGTFLFTTMLLAMGSIYFLSGLEAAPTRIFFLGARGFLMLATLFLLGTELGRTVMPPPLPDGYRKLYIIGGALSTPTQGPSYAEILQQQYGIPVYNLSFAGNDMRRAMEQAKLISSDDVVILVEPGWLQNGREPAASLTPLLQQLGGNGRRVLMFELPVLNRAAGCRAGQRDAAARTGTTILPRRLLGRLVYSGHAAASAHRRLAAELLPLP